jgi:hypothetical protein
MHRRGGRLRPPLLIVSAWREAPAAARLPGLAGLLPFIALAAALFMATAGSRPWIEQLFLTYGAVILTFVGALHWGIGLMLDARPEDQREQPVAAFAFGWSVVPALWAWLALALPFVPGLGLLAAGFALQFTMDRSVAGRLGLPAWYLALRLLLTAVVLLALLAASAASAFVH